MSFFPNQSSLRSRARMPLLACVACMACIVADVADARAGPQARRTAAPRMAFENRGARQAERAQQRAQQRQAQERPPEAAPAPVEPPSQPPAGRPGRLTPDERRALRQQINDAGREIYRPGRP